MEKLHHPLGRGISYLLIYLTAIQPLHPAFAAGINPTNTTTQVQAGNVPVINIATPNSTGISHNTYKDFNVGAPGAVLNNSTVAGKSQLAGQVNANTNLKGNAANLIINEVTGGTRSELNGKLEVFGAKANVMIANPNGITCDGCGFINTPGVTLTTGKPQFDKQGALDALEVKKGSIIIGSKGLDASALDYVDIISRATELNGKITAQNLSLTQGANRASYKDGMLTAIAGEGAQPQLAVDTKALGGMYANKIRLVANEEGVGVNLANLTSTQQGITLDTKGKIQLGNTVAKTDLNITAKQTDIIKGATVKSERDITVASSTLNNAGTLNAGKDMRLFNDNLTNTLATIQANNNLWIQKDAVGNKGVKVENRSGTIKTTTGDLVIRTERLDNIIDNYEVVERDILPTESIVSNDRLGWHVRYIGGFGHVIYHVTGAFSSEEPKKWFNAVDFNNLYDLNVERKEYVKDSEKISLISSGNNIYINSSSLNNKLSTIRSIKDMVLTGDLFFNKSIELGTLDKYNFFSRNPILDALRPELGSLNDYILDAHLRGATPFKHTDEGFLWHQKETLLASIISGGTLTADFKKSISVESLRPYENKKISESKVENDLPFSISAKSVLLNAGMINISGGVKSDGDINMISGSNITLDNASLTAKDSITMLASNNIDAKQSYFFW